MRNLDIIYKAIEFIERKLKEPLKIKDVADEVGFSIYHFIRVFNQITKYSPKDYILRRRLSEAAKALLRNDRSILDISLEYGFNNHETFTRAFKKMFGLLPSDVKRDRHMNSLILRTKITREYLVCINDQKSLEPTYKEISNMKLVGISFPVKEFDECIQSMWNKFIKYEEFIRNVSFSQKFYSVYMASTEYRSQAAHRINDGAQFIGLQVDEIEDHLASILVAKTISNLKCAKFIYIGHPSGLKFMYSYILQTWFPKSGYRQGEFFKIECFEIKKTKNICEIEILIPIEKISEQEKSNL